jgi:hypothetical protein
VDLQFLLFNPSCTRQHAPHSTTQQSQHTITQQSSQTLKQAWEEEEEEREEEATKGLPFALNALASLAAPFHSCECGPPLASPHLPQIGRRKKKERRNAGLILASLGCGSIARAITWDGCLVATGVNRAVSCRLGGRRPTPEF